MAKKVLIVDDDFEDLQTMKMLVEKAGFSAVPATNGAKALDMLKAGKRFSYFHLFGNSLFRFVRDYIFKRGFLDGFPGLVVAVNTAFYVFIKQAKLWELERNKGQPAKPA